MLRNGKAGFTVFWASKKNKRIGKMRREGVGGRNLSFVKGLGKQVKSFRVWIWQEVSNRVNPNEPTSILLHPNPLQQ